MNKEYFKKKKFQQWGSITNHKNNEPILIDDIDIMERDDYI